MNLEEKRKEIEALCQNLDESDFNFLKSMVNESDYFVYGFGEKKIYNILIEDEFNCLLAFLIANQKEPEIHTWQEIYRLYTWKEIDRVREKWIEERHTIKEHTSVFDFLKQHIKPYKK